MTTTAEETREQVRARYAAAAIAVTDGAAGDGCCAPTESAGCCSAGSCAPESVDVDETFGAGLYSADEQAELPADALAASLGCGNPTAVAELRVGDTVLDLGSGGGIDVILSAKRFGPTGTAYGLDMPDEMLALAQQNARDAAVAKVHFL